MLDENGQSGDATRRESMQLFDMLFKYTLKEASPGAVVHLINGLFDKSHSPGSAVTFLSSESVAERQGKLEKIISDIILAIGSESYLIEAQIDEDKTIALRVFQYGFAAARQRRRMTEDGSRITLTMPEARVIYWESAGKTPDKVVLRLEFPGKGYYDYEIETFKVLDQSVGELEARKMALLSPFYLLKFRKELKKSGGDGGKRAEIAGKLEKLSLELEAAVERSRERGFISGEDAIMTLENLLRMQRELYGGYAEFEEVYMMMEERLRPRWKEYLKEGRKEGLKEGLKEGQNQVLALLEQGYTLEQVKAALARVPPETSHEQASERAG
jgi:hypothetical protein